MAISAVETTPTQPQVAHLVGPETEVEDQEEKPKGGKWKTVAAIGAAAFLGTLAFGAFSGGYLREQALRSLEKDGLDGIKDIDKDKIGEFTINSKGPLDVYVLEASAEDRDKVGENQVFFTKKEDGGFKDIRFGKSGFFGRIWEGLTGTFGGESDLTRFAGAYNKAKNSKAGGSGS